MTDILPAHWLTEAQPWSEAEHRILDTARQFRRQEIDPHAAEWDRNAEQPRALFQAAGAKDLLALETPEAHGGLGVRFSVKLAITEEWAQSCMGASFSLVNTQNVAARIAQFGRDSHRARYLSALLKGDILGGTALSEPGAGSDFAAISTFAEKVPNGWRLNGEKGWITNARHGTVFVVYAQTDTAKRGRGIAAFLVDASEPGFVRRPPYELFGGNGIGAGGFALENYFAPDEDLFFAPGEAFKAALQSINGARTYVAGMCCGMLAAGLAHAIRYGGERQTFGAPLLAHQGLKWMLADVATDLEAARLLTRRAADLLDRGQDAVLAAAHAKKFAARVAQSRLPDCIQALGANGLRRDYPLGRHLASAKIAHYVDGTTEIQNDRIGALLSHYSFGDSALNSTARGGV